MIIQNPLPKEFCKVFAGKDKREELFLYLSTTEPGFFIKVRPAQQTGDIKLLKEKIYG